MKRIIKGYVTWRAAQYGAVEPTIDLLTFDPRSSSAFSDRVVVHERDIEIEVPDDFDPRPLLIEVLRNAEIQVRADFAVRITQIKKQIGELEAIEYLPEEAVL